MLKLKTHSGFHDLFLKYTVQSNNSSCRSVLTPKDLVSPLLIGCLPDEKKMKRDMTTNGVTLDFIAILYRKKKSVQQMFVKWSQP